MTQPTQPTASRLADALNALRPDWPIRSIETVLRDPLVRNKTIEDIAVAAVRLALDPNCRTPGQLRTGGNHWRHTFAGPEQSNRPEPPPINQLKLGVDKPADPTPHIEAMRSTLQQHKQQRKHVS